MQLSYGIYLVGVQPSQGMHLRVSEFGEKKGFGGNLPIPNRTRQLSNLDGGRARYGMWPDAKLAIILGVERKASCARFSSLSPSRKGLFRLAATGEGKGVRILHWRI
jgi:hypothetical protein